MAWRRTGDNSEPMPVYCQLETKEQILMNFQRQAIIYTNVLVN